MKQQPKARRRKQRPAANLVPSFEECLTFLMDNLSHSRDGLKTSTLSAKEKQRFRQMECKADALALDDYRDILRRILAPGLHDLTAESKAHVEVLLEERTQFLKRYEALNSQVVPGNAKRHEVLWVLSHRFFLPWLALRLAYRLPDDTDISTTADDCWFLPLHGDGFSSCVMKVIDRFVRAKNESNAELARRLYSHLPKDERDRLAMPFEGDLSKYSQRTTTPSDATIGLLVRGTDAVPHLRLMLVLARFTDRCVRDARKVFDDGLVLELLDYFVLCFVHFRGVLKQVRSEVSASPHDKVQEFRFSSTGEGVPIIPATEAERVWLRLNSPTEMGNTPGQWARFLPLMDKHMVELARRINTELGQTVRSEELSVVPRDDNELNAGHYPFRIPTAIPEAIEKAPLHGSVQAAVEVSQRVFCGRVNLAAAIAAKQRFEFLGLGTFVVTADARPGFCSPEDAALAELECKRLFRLIYEQAPERHRPRLALQLLKYLIEPSRPKTSEDRKLARALFKVVSKPMRQRKQRGAVHYFTGCLHALDNEHKKALKAFREARKLGRESCGMFWLDLLRAGMLMADSVGAIQEQKNFAKRAGMIGLFTNDATPRTNEMKAQMRAEDYLRAAAAAFKPFPSK